jgi:cytochrome P450
MVLALAMHPDVQRRAQAEIDSVTGRTRLPNSGDRSSLPYVEAIANEALRWMNVHPLGVYKCSIEDDFYEGYFIPAGM